MLSEDSTHPDGVDLVLDDGLPEHRKPGHCGCRRESLHHLDEGHAQVEVGLRTREREREKKKKKKKDAVEGVRGAHQVAVPWVPVTHYRCIQ